MLIHVIGLERELLYSPSLMRPRRRSLKEVGER
jgi:hypothetical protein